MVEIIHYDVYSNSGDDWDFEERFTEEEKKSAYLLSKTLRNANKAIKIVCEKFDIEDNTYSENIEYFNDDALKSNKNKAPEKTIPKQNEQKRAKKIQKKNNSSKKNSSSKEDIAFALIKATFITIFGLFITNIIVILLFPLVEYFASHENIKTIMFFIFFFLFLIISLPLLMKKVPWEVFIFEEKAVNKETKKQNIIQKAIYINGIYNINNVLSYPPIPVARNIKIEYKNDILNFLNSIISSLQDFKLKSDFSKLGLKFIIFGGSMELSRYSGLNFASANALLYEAFEVIDGEGKVSLEDFYEAKSAYRDSEIAAYLSGMGVNWMQNSLLGKKNQNNNLNKIFGKWKNLGEKTKVQNNEHLYLNQTIDNIFYESIVSIKSMIKFHDPMNNENNYNEKELEKTNEAIQNIINNIISRYHGIKISENNNIIYVRFSKINMGVKFAIDILKNINLYQTRLDKYYIVFYNSCNIIKYTSDLEEIKKTVDDLFVHSFNNEIVTTQDINQNLEKNYQFEYLGSKNLTDTKSEVGLYRIII